jgi:coproporphyrinogen III oxidase-like Fe-S oxidoreductase
MPESQSFKIMDENQKKNDESWKEAVDKEKEALKNQGKLNAPEPDFNFFITTLALQASIALGQIPNPATNKTEYEPQQAQFLIDTLGMLQEKTKGNLNPEESKLLENVLYELRTMYLAKQQEGIK